MNGWDSLIEATIDGIRIDAENKEARVELRCAWEGGGRAEIVATGVDDVVVDQVRLSNVVDRVHLFDASVGDDEVARRLFFLMRGREPNLSELGWPVLQDKLARIRDGVLCLLEIEPVYGARVLVLAENIRLEPRA